MSYNTSNAKLLHSLHSSILHLFHVNLISFAVYLIRSIVYLTLINYVYYSMCKIFDQRRKELFGCGIRLALSTLRRVCTRGQTTARAGTVRALRYCSTGRLGCRGHDVGTPRSIPTRRQVMSAMGSPSSMHHICILEVASEVLDQIWTQLRCVNNNLSSRSWTYSAAWELKEVYLRNCAHERAQPCAVRHPSGSGPSTRWARTRHEHHRPGWNGVDLELLLAYTGVTRQQSLRRCAVAIWASQP